jgi:hypothetical protein
MRRADELRKLVSKKVVKTGAADDGLIAWWTFDEPASPPVAFDHSGHRLGGSVRDAKRTKGIFGNALVCDGGCVVVENNPLLSPTNALTIECWVKAGAGPLRNNWIVNRVFGGDPFAGYRLGVVEGKPCFQIPLKPWTHHLAANKPLPAGQWVHLAATFDGQTMRLYMNGEECGTMSRPAPIKPNAFHLCLGNYEIAHSAHFDGLLDEVRLYARALTTNEIRQRAGNKR